MANGMISSAMTDPNKRKVQPVQAFSGGDTMYAGGAPGGQNAGNKSSLEGLSRTTSGQTPDRQTNTRGGVAPGGTNYDPERINFGREDTVEGRVDDIIAKDSPLMQRAGTRAKQAANSRGLLNTSMAVEAGQAAVMDAATPIASQDAQSSLAVKQSNQSAGNQAGQFNAGANLEVDLQELRGVQAKELSRIENDYKVLLQANQSAGGLFAATQEAISNILANPDIPAGQKAELVDRQNQLLESGLGVIGGISNLDLGGLLDFGGGSGGSSGSGSSNTVNAGGKNYDSLVVSALRDIKKKIDKEGGLSRLKYAGEIERIRKDNDLTEQDIRNILGG